MVYTPSWPRLENPWERHVEDNEDFYTPDIVHYQENLSDKWPMFVQDEKNRYINVDTKKAALSASPFVVSLVSYTGEKELNICSGFIIAIDDTNTNTNIVFTSANLIRKPCDIDIDMEEEEVLENELAANLKVQVKLADGRSFEGVLCAFNFNYNIAALRFVSDSPVFCAPLKLVEDCVDLNPEQQDGTSIQLCPHSSSSKLAPGDAIVGVGRYFAYPFKIMAAPGNFSLDRCDYDCKELFNATCRITKCGDGGPLLNLVGDVIGIAFYGQFFTPFLPINIAYKWWELYKKYGGFRQPVMGIEVTNFYAADLDVIEKVILAFPSVSKGVIVEKVIPGSFADCAGLRLNDVIIQCGGIAVSSFLEFVEVILDNVGQIVELVVARAGCITFLHPKVMVAKLAADKLNRWPR